MIPSLTAKLLGLADRHQLSLITPQWCKIGEDGPLTQLRWQLVIDSDDHMLMLSPITTPAAWALPNTVAKLPGNMVGAPHLVKEMQGGKSQV